MSNRPRNAVIAPVGSLSKARATGRPYRSDEPLMFLIAAAAALAAAVSPTSSTTRGSHDLAVSGYHIVDAPHLRIKHSGAYAHPGLLTDFLRNERFRLVGRTHHYRLMGFFTGEAQWDQRRADKARNRHSDRE